MSLSHRLSRFCVGFIAICTLGGIYAPQEARSQPPSFPPTGPISLMVPQFVAEAVLFKAIDETGYDWAGSDEVYAVFSDLNPTLDDLVTAEYGDVDAGETRNFGPNEPNEVVARDFCLVGSYGEGLSGRGLYELYRRCE